VKTQPLIDQYENFRSSMVSGINNLEIDEAQKQIFMISLQTFYLKMLLQIPQVSTLISSEFVEAEILK
jgi:hypothetical protein